MAGDTLAGGAIRASFAMPKVSQEKWDSIWEEPLKEKWEPRYSGPNRSGICKCGHNWDVHHLGVVMNRDYAEQTGEAYLPEECEYHGFNEVGGLERINGKWEDHCHRYVDSKEN